MYSFYALKNYFCYLLFGLLIAIGQIICVLACTHDNLYASDENNSHHKQPNLILILVDDAGYDDFGFTGCTDWKTPQIDALASSGITFTQAYVSASVCGPSRAGLITGRYQQSFGVEENLTGKTTEPIEAKDYGLPITVPTIGTLLKKKGYRTAAFGKWHLGEYQHFHPNNRGFDYFYGFLGGHRSYWPLSDTLTAGPQSLMENQTLTRTSEYFTDQLGKKCAQFIEKNSENPFFIYLSYNAVHSPLHYKKEDQNVLGDIHSDKRRILGAMTIALDRSIGYVIDELKKQELYSNTLVLFTNDNGAATYLETNNAGMRGRKGTVWEGGLRVPFCLSWPDTIREGQIRSNLVSTLDIASTFCSVAGYSPEEIEKLKLDGIDLLETNTKEGRSTPLFWKRGNTSAIRQGPWKLIALNGRPSFLFEISKDPLENENLLESHPNEVQNLEKSLLGWQSNNPIPIWVKTTANILADKVMEYWDGKSK